jgi:hypothetical protein
MPADRAKSFGAEQGAYARRGSTWGSTVAYIGNATAAIALLIDVSAQQGRQDSNLQPPVLLTAVSRSMTALRPP